MWSTCSCFSYSSNAICLGLCDVCLCVAGGGGLVSASPSCSGILRGVLFLNSCCSYEGEGSQE